MEPILIADKITDLDRLLEELQSNFGGTGTFFHKEETNEVYWTPRQEHVLNDTFETRIFWFAKGWLTSIRY